MPSPACEVKDGAGAYASTTDGVNVTPGNTVTVHLIDTSADTWSIECVYTDETSDAATVTAALTIDPDARTATFTAPAAGKAYIFRSRVNDGIGPNGRAVSSYTTTFGIYTLTESDLRVIAANETTESGPFGWSSAVNGAIRNGGGAGGETTTGANVGASGARLFKGKSGAQLQFRRLKRATSKAQASVVEGADEVEAAFCPPGWFNVIDYGADPTGTTDSAAAINAAIHATGPGGPWGGENSRGAVVYVPPGIYRLSSSIIIDRAISLLGAGAPGWFSPSRLHADNGITAIVVSNGPADYDNPPGDGGGPGDGAGAWSTIRGLAVLGFGGGLGAPGEGAIPDAHGIDILASCDVNDCYITGFTGNGINLDCASGIRGNANCTRATNCFLEHCENGIYIKGPDVNASTFVALSATNNRSWQIWDESFLGNTHIGHHARANGLAGEGSYRSKGANNESIWIGCYSEEGSWSEFDLPATVLGGQHGSPNRGSASAPPNIWKTSNSFNADWAPAWTPAAAVYERYTICRPTGSSTEGPFRSVPCWYICETSGTTGEDEPNWATAGSAGMTITDGTAVWRCLGSCQTTATLGSGGIGSRALQFSSNDELASWALERVLQSWRLRWGASDEASAFTLGGTGRFPGVNAGIAFPLGAVLGDNTTRDGLGRRVVFVAEEPTSGYWRRGDWALNAHPDAGGDRGWVCVDSGQSDASSWSAALYCVAGQCIKPATPNGYVYQCVLAVGTNSVTGSGEPTWPTAEGAQVIDGDITWECAGVDTGPVFETLVSGGDGEPGPAGPEGPPGPTGPTGPAGPAGTADLPTFTGAGKVLATNDTEDGAEWRSYLADGAGADVASTGLVRIPFAGSTPVVIAGDSINGNYVGLIHDGTASKWTIGNSSEYADIYGYGITLYGGAEKVRASDGPSGIVTDLTVASMKLNSNFTTTANTATATPFSIPVKSGEVWKIEFQGSVQCSSTGGVKFSIGAPTGSTVEGWIDSSTNAIATRSLQRFTAVNTLNGTALHTVGTTPGPDWIDAVVTAGDDGNIVINAASVTGGQTTTIFAGSYFRARRVSGV